MNEIPYTHEKQTFTQKDIDNINEACYDNKAYLWDRFPFPSILPNYVKKYANTNLGTRVLDIGSGTGQLAIWLVAQGFNVQCIDPSLEMVKRCREKGLMTIQTTIQNYQPDSSFSMIFAILSLIHVPKATLPNQIKKISEALLQDGVLFLAMIEGQGEGFFNEADTSRFFAYYSAKEIEDILQPYFKKVDYHYLKSGSIGYMLFVFKKI